MAERIPEERPCITPTTTAKEKVITFGDLVAILRKRYGYCGACTAYYFWDRQRLEEGEIVDDDTVVCSKYLNMLKTFDVNFEV